MENAKTNFKTRILNLIETNVGKNGFFSISKSSPYGVGESKELLDAVDRVTTDDIKSASNYVFKNPPITSIVASENTLKTLNLI